MGNREIIELLKDPIKLACVMHCLSTIENLEDAMKEHGEQEVVKIAIEATKEAFGGGTS